MFKKLLPITLLSYFVVVVINFGCTKLDTTTLGSDLIPAVDNVHTFSTTLDINTTQGYFNDSFKIFKTENNVLGYTNDPIFGQTEANIFLHTKPTFYPFYFGNAGGTLVGVDSVVLCLSYKGSWGDTNQLQTLSVFPINDQPFADSVFQYKDIRFQPTLGPSIGSRVIDIRRLKDSVKIAWGRDSVINQIRIKLSSSYANTLFGRDSTKAGLTNNNAFYNDSIHRRFYNGFAVKAGGSANALMYINLTDATTRLEVHFRKKITGTGKLDTVYNSFKIATDDYATIIPSATSNYIKRNWSASVLNPAASDLYLQSGPGTYASLKIPGLDTLTNRIVHRAQISIEQIPDNPVTDSIFSVPSYVYLDLKDTGVTKWKPIYHDLSPSSTYDPDYKSGFPYYPSDGTIDYAYFGGFARKRNNVLGQSVYYYDLNVTRYIQQLVTKGIPNYEMRLFAGFRVLYPQHGTALFPATAITLDNPLAYGRIKIKSGSYPDPQKQVKMRMTIIWSKL
ncbi:MAG: DUF4270 family protein [Ferruginibacter sp.]